MANQVMLDATSVAQGGTLTGMITGDNIQSVTVSGCGFDNQAIGADDNATMTGRQFTLNLGSGQATGSCNLTFTITSTGGGAATTQVVAVTVTAAAGQATATTRPELRSAQIVSTTQAGQQTPGALNQVGTVVRYTFDGQVTGAAVTQANFLLYEFDGDSDAADYAEVDRNDANSVLARFDEFTNATGGRQTADLTLATVDPGAVTGTAGTPDTNPEGDAPIGTARVIHRGPRARPRHRT